MPATKKELLLSMVLFLAIPALCELGLRLVHYSAEPQLYCPDRQLGWKLRARAEGVVSNENRQHVRINAQGFRDVERSYPKAKTTVRIAVLGNSWTEALQVPQENTYCAVLERRLTGSSCFGGAQVEVLNFGVAGYSTAQELLLLQQEVWKYHPDVVLLSLYPARDIANNVQELNNAVNPEQSPYLVFQDGKLVLDDSFRHSTALQPQAMALQTMRYNLEQHVRLLQAIGELQRDAKVRIAMAAMKDKAQHAGVENLEYSIYAPPVDPAMDKAWHVTEALLLAMRDEVQAHGAQFRLIIQATRPQVLPEMEKREALLRQLGVNDLAYANRRIRDFGTREGIAVIDLAPALSSYALTNHVYLNGFNQTNFGAGHWNETGHRVAAEAIAAGLCGNENSTPHMTAADSVRLP